MDEEMILECEKAYKQGQLDELNKLMRTKDKNKAVAWEDIIINRIKYLQECSND